MSPGPLTEADVEYLRYLPSEELAAFLTLVDRRSHKLAIECSRQIFDAAAERDDGRQTGFVKKPHARQAEFLRLDCDEALFGGAVGGGKTEALLMWLSEGVTVPGYSALFLRRFDKDYTHSTDSPIERSKELYKPLGGTLRGQTWRFPTEGRDAMIEFGHMNNEETKERYRGAAYHRAAWDELTQFSETQYEFLWSRMRRHATFPIKCGFRCASNPGGPGHRWVRTRFVTREAEAAIAELGPKDLSPPGMVFWTEEGRAFVPSRVCDNPTLHIEEYIKSLKRQLSPVLLARLLNGDWSVIENAQIKPEWIREYSVTGNTLRALRSDGKVLQATNSAHCRRFATVDTAGTSKQKAKESKGKPPSWSVCAIWDYWQEHRLLFLRHVWRDRVEWSDLKADVAAVCRQWHVPFIIVEAAHHGIPLATELQMMGLHATTIGTHLAATKVFEAGNAKLERAVASGFLSKLEAGEILLPRYEHQWRPELEAEWLTWTGHDDETADQVDVASYACIHVDDAQYQQPDGNGNARPLRKLHRRPRAASWRGRSRMLG